MTSGHFHFFLLCLSTSYCLHKQFNSNNSIIKIYHQPLAPSNRWHYTTIFLVGKSDDFTSNQNPKTEETIWQTCNYAIITKGLLKIQQTPSFINFMFGRVCLQNLSKQGYILKTKLFRCHYWLCHDTVYLKISENDWGLKPLTFYLLARSTNVNNSYFLGLASLNLAT